MIHDFPLVVGEKTYTLRLGINAMCRLEEKLDKKVNAELFLLSLVAACRKGSPRLSDVRLALWAALGDHHPDISDKEVGQLIDDSGSMVDVAKALAVVMQESLLHLYTGEKKGA